MGVVLAGARGSEKGALSWGRSGRPAQVPSDGLQIEMRAVLHIY